MTEPDTPPQRVSNRISPLAIIILAALIVLAVFAFERIKGRHVTPSGVTVPTADAPAVMRRQPAVPNTLQRSANTNDADEARPSDDRETPANSSAAGGG